MKIGRSVVFYTEILIFLIKLFSSVLNKVFVDATKPTMKTKQTGFISYSSDYPYLLRNQH